MADPEGTLFIEQGGEASASSSSAGRVLALTEMVSQFRSFKGPIAFKILEGHQLPCLHRMYEGLVLSQAGPSRGVAHLP